MQQEQTPDEKLRLFAESLKTKKKLDTQKKEDGHTLSSSLGSQSGIAECSVPSSEEKLRLELKSLKEEKEKTKLELENKLLKEFTYAFKHHFMCSVVIYSEVARGKLELKSLESSAVIKVAQIAIPAIASQSSNFWVSLTSTFIPIIISEIKNYSDRIYFANLLKFVKSFRTHVDQEEFYNTVSHNVALANRVQICTLTEQSVNDFAFYLINKLVIKSISQRYRDKISGVMRFFSSKDPDHPSREEVVYRGLIEWKGKGETLLETQASIKKRIYAESLVYKCGIVDQYGAVFKEPQEDYGYRFLYPQERQFYDYKIIKTIAPPALLVSVDEFKQTPSLYPLASDPTIPLLAETSPASGKSTCGSCLIL